MNTHQMNREKATKVYAALITLMLFASATGLVVYHDSLTGLKLSMDDERLKNETLYSEKLSLEKEIAMLQEKLGDMKGQNSLLNAKWKNAMASLDSKEKTITTMTSENKQARQLISDVKVLRQVKSEMEKEFEFLKSELMVAKADNLRLNDEIVSLNEEKDALSRSLASLSQVAVNNSLVEAVKGRRDHLTVKARQTKKLKVGFELPEDMIGNLYFKMATPEGKEVTSEQSLITFYETPVMSEMIASVDGMVQPVAKKHIEMTYQPKEKLESGIYKIDVYSSGKYLGTTRVHLK